jgi:hypothetical protein
MTDREVLGDDVDRKVWRFQPIALVERQKREGEGNEKKNLDGCAILLALTATNAQENSLRTSLRAARSATDLPPV